MRSSGRAGLPRCQAWWSWLATAAAGARWPPLRSTTKRVSRRSCRAAPAACSTKRGLGPSCCPRTTRSKGRSWGRSRWSGCTCGARASSTSMTSTGRACATGSSPRSVAVGSGSSIASASRRRATCPRWSRPRCIGGCRTFCSSPAASARPVPSPGSPSGACRGCASWRGTARWCSRPSPTTPARPRNPSTLWRSGCRTRRTPCLEPSSSGFAASSAGTRNPPTPCRTTRCCSRRRRSEPLGRAGAPCGTTCGRSGGPGRRSWE